MRKPPLHYPCPYCTGHGVREVPTDLAEVFRTLEPAGTPLEAVRRVLDCTPSAAQNALTRLINMGAVCRERDAAGRWLYSPVAVPPATSHRRSA